MVCLPNSECPLLSHSFSVWRSQSEDFLFLCVFWAGTSFFFQILFCRAWSYSFRLIRIVLNYSKMIELSEICRLCMKHIGKTGVDCLLPTQYTLRFYIQKLYNIKVSISLRFFWVTNVKFMLINFHRSFSYAETPKCLQKCAHLAAIWRLVTRCCTSRFKRRKFISRRFSAMV